jgi:ubiquinone/menaquinone biosynthesis C-methylase UbiE
MSTHFNNKIRPTHSSISFIKDIYMNTSDLISLLEAMEKVSESNFTSKLNARKIEEIEHSNIIHAPISQTSVDDEVIAKHARSRHVYETNSAVRNYLDNWIKNNVKDKIVLDLACGSGEQTKLAHSYGAKLSIGTDLASLTLKCNREQRSNNQNNLYYILDDAENMSIPSNSIDIVICSGMLHHVVLEKTILEIDRVLKPGGKVLALEALKHNPVIALYRRLTPNARTHWETAHILGVQDARFLGSVLTIKSIKYWQLFSILAIFFPESIRSKALRLFNFLDNIILKIPYINRMAWIFTIELIKPDK